MPKTNYDRYYMEELVKKYPKLEQLEELLQTVKDIDAGPDEFVEVFLSKVQTKEQNEAERKKKEQAKRIEE